MTARYTEHSNHLAASWIVNNPMRIEYNGCGMPVELRSRAPILSSLPLQPEQVVRINDCGSAPAYFVAQANVYTVGAGTDRSVPARDASHDAEYEEAHKTLIVPVGPDRAWCNVRCDNRVLPYRFLLISEAHGIYMQHHRRYLPAGTILLFPFASRPVVRNGHVVLRVDTLGIITSPYATRDARIVTCDGEMHGCVAHFEPESALNCQWPTNVGRLRAGYSTETSDDPAEPSDDSSAVSEASDGTGSHDDSFVESCLEHAKRALADATPEPAAKAPRAAATPTE